MGNIQLRLIIGFIAGLVLSILPMPLVMSAFRPSWILLLVLYIEYYLPDSFKLIPLFFAGLLLDVLLSSVIGEHSFALLLVAWIATTNARRFRFFSMYQQMVLIGFFSLLYQEIISFIDVLLGFQYSVLPPFISAFSSVFFWPWIRLLADDTLSEPLHRI